MNVARNKRPAKAKALYPYGTVARAARDLGVTRTHLALVIHGHRISESLTARFAAWQAKSGNPA